MMRRSQRQSAFLAAACGLGAVGLAGCEEPHPQATQETSSRPEQVGTETVPAATLESELPAGVEIDPGLLEEHLGHLEGLEPSGGWSGVPGPDLQWCMAELGWEVTTLPDGSGIQFEIVADQAVAFETAMAACEAMHPISSEEYFNKEFLTLDYEDKLRVADCLNQAGYAVEGAPTEEVYVEQTLLQRLSTWDPVMELPFAEREQARAQCPQTPGWELMAELDLGDSR